MRIITPTKLQKKKLKEMILKLFPQYTFIRIADNGIISLSKSFWHFIFMVNKKVHVSELCTVYIPERLDELYCTTFENGKFHVSYSNVVMELLHHRSKSVIDYLYDEFIGIKHGIHKAYYTERQIVPETMYSLSEMIFSSRKYGEIVLSRLSNVQVKQSLKHWKDSLFVLNHPKLASNRLNLWFKKEFKKELRQIYLIQVNAA